MIQLVVAILFAIWFGSAASRADRNVVGWALGGAALVLLTGAVVVRVGFLIVAAIAGKSSFGAGFGLLIGLWVVGLVIALAIGSAILPESNRADLEVQLAAQRAKPESDEPASLRCNRCDRRLTKREALIEGAIRIDDETCVCAACKHQALSEELS